MFSVKNFLIVACCLICCLSARAADWTQQKSGTLAWLHDVYFVNENKGFIVGSSGILLLTTDSGKTWRAQEKFTTDTIEQIYFSDENTGWLLCEKSLFERGALGSSYLLKTTDGGAHWEQISFGGGRERITKIFFAKNNFAMAIGETGVLFALQDDAKTWKRMISPTRYLLLDGNFTDEFHGTIVGAGGSVLFTEDAGATWNQAMLSGDAKTRLNKVFFINQKLGWTLGSAGKIYQTVNGGKTWHEQKSGVEENLTDVFFLNTAEGWAVGDDGTILHTTTGGNVWSVVDSKIKHRLEKVFFSGRKGWAVGFGGTILSFDETKTSNNSQLKPQMRSRRD
ncbi:MAG: YCF48-related protein [Acidobacteriota bacterium]|nr:YCF48-related protein [Acidobacteriota bacterium]